MNDESSTHLMKQNIQTKNSSMRNRNRKNRLVLTIAILGLAVAGFVWFASQYNLNGLNPGDVFSQSVVRNEGAVETRLATVYGQEVIEARRLFRSAKLGPRQPRMQIAVLAPRGAFVNGSGFRSGYGEDHSVRREIMSWGVMRTEHDWNNTVQKTLTWEYDGRKREVRIEGQSFPLTDGNRFVVLLDKDWKPSVNRVNNELNIPPYLKGKDDELRKFFNLDHAKAGYLIPAVQAEPLDERNKLAVELVELIAANKPNARPSAEDFKQDIADQIDRTILQLKLSAKDSEVFREAALGATAGVDVDRMTTIMVNTYASKLSAKELKETIVFFKTDTGKAWLRKSVAIKAEMIAQRKVLTAEVMEATRRRLTELRSRIPSDEAP